MGNLSQAFDAPEAQPFLLEAGRHAVLLIHGFTGTPAHMRPLGEALAQRGVTARGIRLPGHGRTPEDMQKSSWSQWLYAAREAARALAATHESVTLCGLSMGALLALLLAPDAIPGACVCLSAPLRAANRFLPFAALAAPFHPMTRWHDEPDRAARLDARYDIGYDRFPTARAHDLKRLMDMAGRTLFGVTRPLLVVQSRADDTVRQSSADTILRGACSARKEMLWLDTAHHVCTLSPELPQIAERVAAFATEPKQNAV